MVSAKDRLKATREYLGAPLLDWGPERGPSKRLLDALRSAAGVPIKKVNLDDIAGPGGLLAYEDAAVVLYIKDTRIDRITLETSPANPPRFHLVDCSTLHEMRSNNRFERYVVSQKTDGMFRVEPDNQIMGRPNDEIDVRLYPCKNCLNHLNYEGCKNLFVDTNKVMKNLPLETFFFEYQTFFKSTPKHSDITAPLGGYVSEWNKISRSYRQRCGWKCEQCGVALRDYTKLLHAHHKNGVTTNNFDANLASLCVICHSKQPKHSWGIKPADRETIERLRREQGI